MKLRQLLPNHKTLTDIFMLWVGTVGGAGLAFLIQMILPRYLERDEFGTFSSALAINNLLLPLAGFGVCDIILKTFGIEGWGAIRWLKGAFGLTTFMTIFVLICLTLWAVLGPHNAVMRDMILLLLPVVPAQVVTQLIGSRMQLEERYKMYVIWHIVQHILRFMIIAFLFMLFIPNGLYLSVVTYSVISIGVTLLGIKDLHGMINGRFNLKHHLPSTNINNSKETVKATDVAKSSFPYGLAGVFSNIYFQTTIIYIQYYIGSEAAGAYSIAFTILIAVLILPNTIYGQYLIPKIHRWSAHDQNKLLKVYRYGVGVMFLLGGLSSISIIFLSPFFIPLLFGNKMIDAAYILTLIAPAIFFRFLSYSFGSILLTKDHINKKVVVMGIVAVTNIVISWFLIPKCELFGAVLVTIFTEALLASLYLITVYKYIFKKDAITGWTFKYS